MLNPNAQCDGFGDGAFASNKGGTLTNGIDALINQTPESSLTLPASVRTRQEDGRLGSRKPLLPRHWLYQDLDLGLHLQNCEQSMLVVKATQSAAFFT